MERKFSATCLLDCGLSEYERCIRSYMLDDTIPAMVTVLLSWAMGSRQHQAKLLVVSLASAFEGRT